MKEQLKKLIDQGELTFREPKSKKVKLTDTKHMIERIKSRFDSMTEYDIPPNTRRSILNNLNKLKENRYEVNKSYAVLLGKFDINSKSSFYKNVNGREYYSIIDLFGKDSTGDQIWVIIRSGQIKTFMLRKEIQSDKPIKLKKGLKVTDVIYNLYNY